MPLDDFLASLEAVSQRAREACAAVADADALETVRIELLGAKSGQLRKVQKGLGSIEKADKPVAGRHFNEVKALVETALAEAQQRLGNAGSRLSEEDADLFDLSTPGKPVRLGHLHPITQTIRSMKEIMGRLGFSAVEGPEIEDDWHNFEALNIPRTHPARDPLDNFYLATAQVNGSGRANGSVLAGGAGESDCQAENTAFSKPMLLRSQTSTVQIRVMESQPPPVRVISLGRVYRPDTADATHYPMFYQIEGLLVDQGVTMADLKSVLRLFYQSYFGGDDRSAIEEVHIRFRTSYFPFTEPSVEFDMNWHSGWMEMGGAGMVDPNVLRAVGYDPEKVTGFAFGLGVERICMRQHGITDIRDLYQNDMRFLEQF
jgi:phenylalanyl-tRNA synthetase alpha chain